MHHPIQIENPHIRLIFSGKKHFFEYQLKQDLLKKQITFPFFCIDGIRTEINIEFWQMTENPKFLRNGAKLYELLGKSKVNHIYVKLFLWIPQANPVIRFRYELHSEKSIHFTKSSQKDNLTYFGISLNDFNRFKEIRFSEFNEKSHATHCTESEITSEWFEHSLSVMGPAFIAGNKDDSVILAYEHGSQFPDRFIEFQFTPEKMVFINAVKENYLEGVEINPYNPFETVWFELGCISDSEKVLAQTYRSFILNDICENNESRKPYIFYNTWGRQEFVKWGGKTYQTTMNLDYTLREIEIAHKLGIEFYVIDTGWFEKTGDWKVNKSFFPDELKQVKAKLDAYGMKLGLWFNPTTAALTSRMLKRNKNYRVSKLGKFDEPYEVWETEKSVGLCLVSAYWEDFANRLVELIKEIGVSYFKWDAIWQYGCDAPGHYHGSESESELVRRNRYAFLLPFYMNKVIDRVCEKYPDSIFDFDITEDGRSVGLQFLSKGKYFIINNGPYYHNFDVCKEWKSPTADGNPNIFVNPGTARGWFVRHPLNYDKWIPSILFLTHYLPYEPKTSQLTNIASLMLGQNGIWGDLTQISPEGIELIAKHIKLYKQIREEITISTLYLTGNQGDACEIYEKINPLTGKGLIILFANNTGEYFYVSKSKVDMQTSIPENVKLSFSQNGKAIIKAICNKNNVAILYFGIKKTDNTST